MTLPPPGGKCGYPPLHVTPPEISRSQIIWGALFHVSACKAALRKSKTSDFFVQKYGGFASKVRNFYAKKSDVSVLPKPSPHHHKKKFCEKLPHFLHPTRKAPIKPGYFGCRIGYRKCRRFSKNLFYGGEYAFSPTYCRQRSPTQNETGTSAGDLCAKTLKTHRGRTKFRVVFR